RYDQFVAADSRTSDENRRCWVETATLFPCAGQQRRIWLAKSTRSQDSGGLRHTWDWSGSRFGIVRPLLPICLLFVMRSRNQNAVSHHQAHPRPPTLFVAPPERKD